MWCIVVAFQDALSAVTINFPIKLGTRAKSQIFKASGLHYTYSSCLLRIKLRVFVKILFALMEWIHLHIEIVFTDMWLLVDRSSHVLYIVICNQAENKI